MIRIVVLDSTLDNEMEIQCKYDSVKVYDGFNTSSRHINTWCGTMAPTIQSKSSCMTLHFTTNSNRTYRGFRLRYFATTAQYHCGANLTAKVTPQFLTTPGYPNMYQNEARCRWIIEAPGHNTVQMRVIDSNIENQLFCRYDWAKVLDGNSLTSPRLGVFCGFMTPSYNSTGKYLLVEFHSDSARTFKGFKIQYTTEDDQSGGHRQTYNVALLVIIMLYISLQANL
ncbi:procollagen C-endopeptidase enhancer 1-like [Haliotis asinina]|uniref:procollagen C-endopeptidase enhancer 1-like n=1 Tax=Haliotis asinina TaxID=109174 RepID=UPI003532517F